jgi:ribonuclease Z
MAQIIILGTANAVPSKHHESTHFLVDAGEQMILVDCAGNPVVRLDQAGVDPLSITDLILTHFHPDHVSGVPLLLMDLWLMGRKEPMNVFGLDDVIVRTEKMMEIYNWQDWDGFYPVNFSRLPGGERMPLIETDDAKVWASKGCHMIPSIGLRMQFPSGSLCYSSDTEPCEAIERLAEDVDVLIHESTGEGVGHSSPKQAGEVAQRAGVRKLVLIHYPTDIDVEEWVNQAKSTFSGEVVLATDLMKLSI